MDPKPLSGAVPYANRPLLDYLTGGNYSLRVEHIRSLDSKKADKIRRFIANDKYLSLASATDEKVYLLWVHDYPGWLNFCKPLGLHVDEHPKLPKRLTSLTRQAGPHAIGNFSYTSTDVLPFITGTEKDLIQQYGFDPSVCLDGGIVISQELLSIMSGALDTTQAQVFCGVGSYAQVRALTPSGMIKGDALVSSRHAMGGYDVIYHPESLCPEFASQVPYIMAEPRTIKRQAAHECLDAGNPPLVAPGHTDEQTMAWLGPWLFPNEHMDMAMCDVLESTIGKLERGIPPRFITHTAAIGDSLSDNLIKRAQAFQNAGFGIKSSVFLTYACGNSLLNHLDSSARWPIPNAGHPTVATDAWLRLAGYKNDEWPNGAGYTEQGTVWLHRDTQRLVLNNADFAGLYPRHGGWDLDDPVMAAWRKIDGQKAVVMYRQPNTYGEYSVASHPTGAFHPAWYSPTYGYFDWIEISSQGAPEYLENLDSQQLNPPEFDQQPLRPGEGYTRQTAIAIMEDAIKCVGVLGSWVNVEMAYHATHQHPRPARVASTESVVDACTQYPTDGAISAIRNDAAQQRQDMDEPGASIDFTLWVNRVNRYQPPKHAQLVKTWWTQRNEQRQSRINHARQRLVQVSQQARNNIPQVVYDLGVMYRRVGNLIVRQWYENLVNVDGDDQSRFDRLDQFVANYIDYFEEFSVDVTLAIVANVYTRPRQRGWTDTILFGPRVLSRYIEAIEFYRLNDLDAVWQGLCACNECGKLFLSDDRVETQAARHGLRNCGCKARKTMTA